MDYFVYLFLGALIIFIEIKRERYFAIDHLSIFNFFFFLVYSFTPLALKYYGSDILAHDLELGKYYLWKNEYTSLYILFSYMAFLAGYYLRFSRKIASNLDIELKVTRKTIKLIIPYVYAVLVALLILYITAEGGIKQTIANAELYRGGVIFAKYGFVTRLFPLNQILMFYFFYLLFFEKEMLGQKYNFIFFTISMLIFFLLAAMYNSRGYILVNFLGLYILTAIYYKQYFLKFLLISGSLGVVVIQYADPLFHAVPEFINYGYDAFISEFNHRIMQRDLANSNIVASFSHPMVSLETSLALSGHAVEFRYFVDFLHALYALLPSALLGVDDPKYLMILNTELLYGEEKSIVLPGILALFSYSMHFVGMAIGMFLYGVYGGVLSEIFKNMYIKYNASIVFIYLISFTYGYFVFRGSPRNALMSVFILLMVIIALLLVSKVRYRNQS